MTTPPLIRDLLNLPDQIRKGDFVLSLSEGVQNPEQTVAEYAITENLVDAFDRALGAVGSAVLSGKSQALYLHGSFGAGKSHLMAMLDLLLSNNVAAWKRPELHALKARYAWVGQKKALLLPMHMIGADSIEQRLFSSYVAWVTRNHPSAKVPPLYNDEALFENARSLRASMGDSAFLELLNGPTADTEDDGWGDLSKTNRWTLPDLEDAMASPDPQRRAKAFDVLVSRAFPAFKQRQTEFIELDAGLAVISRHAQSLGYDVVVLLFDELILWLASRSAKAAFVQREAEKLAKLREAQDMNRPIPLVSFIARQRDLADFVGKDVLGVQQTTLQHSLAWSSGRFEEIKLPDSNLTAIIAHRVVRPRDEHAKQQLAEEFKRIEQSIKRANKSGMDALSVGLEVQATHADFQKIYPFSPALVGALIALSESLQRERTAIRLLMELLVDHLPDLRLGELVAVGDLFDALASGDDPTDGVMRERFRRARSLYQEQFLPLLQRRNSTTTPDKCQRMRPAHPIRLGCSGCPQVKCRKENRLIKTVLLAALVPQATPFKDLSASRVLSFNHGAASSVVPGTELTQVTKLFQDFAAQVGQLRVGNERDPRVEIRLDSIDLAPVLDRARNHDNTFNRRALFRKLLFGLLGFPLAGTASSNKITITHVWRGIERKCRVGTERLSEVTVSDLYSPHNQATLVIAYPFTNQDGSKQGSETDGVEAAERLKESTDGKAHAAVWLPIPFGQPLLQVLGDLVLLDHIADGRQQDYLGHFTADDRPRAETQLENLLSQKTKLLQNAIATAYGVNTLNIDEDSKNFDLGRRPKTHWIWLATGTNTAPLALASNPLEQMNFAIERVLQNRYPHHPLFGPEKLTTKHINQCRNVLIRLAEAEDHKTPVTADERNALDRCAKHLGLVTLTESNAHLVLPTFQSLEQALAREHLKNPSVAQVRALIDPRGERGYTEELLNLIVVAFGVWSGRALRVNTSSGLTEIQGVSLENMPGNAVLEQPDLPSAQEWMTALQRLGEAFGEKLPRTTLTIGNVQQLSNKLDALLTAYRDDANKLASRLAPALNLWASPPVDTSPRLQTALNLRDLLNAFAGESPTARARTLAHWQPQTSAPAVKESLKTLSHTVALLADPARFSVFTALKGLLDGGPFQVRAEDVLDRLAQALREDELVCGPLTEIVGKLAQEAGALFDEQAKLRRSKADPINTASVSVPIPTSQPQTDTALQGVVNAASPQAAIKALIADLQKAAAALDPQKPVQISWLLQQPKNKEKP